MAVERLDADKTTLLVPTLLVIVWLARFLPLLLPDARLWGINHLQFLPPLQVVIFAVAGLAGLALFLPPLRAWSEAAFERTSSVLMDRPRRGRWLAFAAVAAAMFWFFRMPTNFLGDGYTIINNLGGPLPAVIKWSEVGAISLVKFVSRLLPYEGLARGEYAYAIVSAISGGITLFLFFLISYELGEEKKDRLFLWFLLTFSGWMLLFFGYVENYPVLWPVVAGYMLVSIRCLAGKQSLALPTIFLLLVLGLHLQTIFLAPSYLALLLSRSVSARWYRRYRTTIRIALGLLGIAAAVLLVNRYRQSLELRTFFVPPFAGRPLTPHYFLFSPSHLLDMIDELSLLIPIWPALVVLGRIRLKGLMADPLDRFLLLVSGGGLLMLAILDPRLGLGRDWDLFALAGFGPMLYLGRRAIGNMRAASWLFLPLTAMALIAVFPYFAVNLSYRPSLAYYEWLLRLDWRQSRPGLIVLRDYFINSGDISRAKAIDQQIYDMFPTIRLARRASDLSLVGRFDEALSLADSVYHIDPYSAEAYNLRGIIYLRMGDYRKAIADMKQSIELAQYDARTQVNLAQAYYNIGRPDSMWIYLRRALKLNPASGQVLQGFAMAFLGQGQYDSAYVYGLQTIQADSTISNGYLAAVVSSYRAGNMARARKYLGRFVDMASPGEDRERALQMLKQIP